MIQYFYKLQKKIRFKLHCLDKNVFEIKFKMSSTSIFLERHSLFNIHVTTSKFQVILIEHKWTQKVAIFEKEKKGCEISKRMAHHNSQKLHASLCAANNMQYTITCHNLPLEFKDLFIGVNYFRVCCVE